jgi:hypothetical protein
LADFAAGGKDRPDVPGLVGQSLTTTIDGIWVVWAYKLAQKKGDRFIPLTGRGWYGSDAKAECLLDGGSAKHPAPDPSCTCGFHAVSDRHVPGLPVPRHGIVCLQVVLSGRVLAYEWESGGVLLRAERQTVVKTGADFSASDRVLAQLGEQFYRPPDHPGGQAARLPAPAPNGSGPVQLSLPPEWPTVALADDAGWCQLTRTEDRVGMASGLAVR